MATIVFKDAVMLIDGSSLETALQELNVEYGAEMLDATVFGLNTRTNKGGLYTGSMSGRGIFKTEVNVEGVFFGKNGLDGSVCVVFPEGVTEGSGSTGRGVAMLGVVEQFDLGGAVGTLGSITWAVRTQGLTEIV